MNAQKYAESFLNTQDFEFSKLAGDAGSRIYYRIKSQLNSFILLDYSNDKGSIKDFLNIGAMLLENNIPSPKIIEHNKDDFFVIIEDLTDYSLEEAFYEKNHGKFYSQAISNLAKLHNISSPISPIKERAFDFEKLNWEVDFGIKHLNKLFKIEDLTASKDLAKICMALDSLPRIICHRDFHSRNLIIKNDEVHFIDFQDARMGPWQYDVVSLLHDSYVNLTDYEVDSLLKQYLDEIEFNPEENWKEHYDLQVIQRTFKACGSFASLKNIKGSERYLAYLPKCFNLLIQKTNAFPELQKYIQRLSSIQNGEKV